MTMQNRTKRQGATPALLLQKRIRTFDKEGRNG